jgi:hypothetical protein
MAVKKLKNDKVIALTKDPKSIVDVVDTVDGSSSFTAAKTLVASAPT